MGDNHIDSNDDSNDSDDDDWATEELPEMKTTTTTNNNNNTKSDDNDNDDDWQAKLSTSTTTASTTTTKSSHEEDNNRNSSNDNGGGSSYPMLIIDMTQLTNEAIHSKNDINSVNDPMAVKKLRIQIENEYDKYAKLPHLISDRTIIPCSSTVWKDALIQLRHEKVGHYFCPIFPSTTNNNNIINKPKINNNKK